MRLHTNLALAALVSGSALAGAPQESADLGALVRELDDRDPDRAGEAWAELVAAGPPAARAALVGFADAPVAGRRARARVVFEVGGSSAVDLVLPLVDDPDATVRETWVEYLARPDHSGARLAERVAALAERARDDAAAKLRRDAIRALGELDDASAVAVLVDLARTLPSPDRALAARSFRPTPRSVEAVRGLVNDGFAPRLAAERTPDDVLAAALPIHGRLLADQAAGGESARDAAPLILGLRHPSRAVRLATSDAFERLLGRLREMGEADRALRVLDQLGRQGLDPRVVHYHRARLAFFPGADAVRAKESAVAIRGAEDSGATLSATSLDGLYDARLWLFRSLYLEGLGELALGAADSAVARLEASGAVLDGILAERFDLGDEVHRYQHVDALHQRTLVEVSLALARLARGANGSDAEVLLGLRRAHVLSLEAQVGFARLNGEAITGWDALLDSDLSPYRVLFTGVAHPGLSIRDALRLQAELGRALATVAPAEVPGFAPFERPGAKISAPLDDPRRFEVLRALHAARIEGVVERLDEVTDRVSRGQASQQWVLPEEDLQLMEVLDWRRRFFLSQIDRADQEGWGFLLELRVPASLALWLARDMRSEGRTVDARRYAKAMVDDLEEEGISRWWYYIGHERLARARMVIGSAYTDDGRPSDAEKVLLEAVEKLESLENRMVEAGASRGDIGAYRSLRASALVSLAVNANVKMGDPAKALEYYERAYALRQDDFMRILLACYRARSGRGDEARALLREVRPGPQVYYNMACTHALLGETERALELLELELEENHASEASRQRQRDWAASDPDLGSLRGDPGFERLIGRR